MAQRTFGSIEPKAKDRSSFTLQGLYEFDVTAPDGEVMHKEGDVWQESFRCLSVVPAGALDRLIASVSVTDTGGLRFQSLRVVDFLTACLMPDDRKLFRILLDDDSRPVDLAEQLIPVMEWLAGPLLGRPTPPPSS